MSGNRPVEKLVRRVVLVCASVLVVPALAAPAAQADDLLYVPWSTSLPGWSDTYTPSSANDCTAGRSSCLGKTLKELARIHDLNGQSCSHNSIFSLAYLRMTQYYGYTRDIAEIAATNRELLTAGQQAARDMFLGLSDQPDGYAHDGRAVVDERRHRLLDRSI